VVGDTGAGVGGSGGGGAGQGLAGQGPDLHAVLAGDGVDGAQRGGGEKDAGVGLPGLHAGERLDAGGVEVEGRERLALGLLPGLEGAGDGRGRVVVGAGDEGPHDLLVDGVVAVVGHGAQGGGLGAEAVGGVRIAVVEDHLGGDQERVGEGVLVAEALVGLAGPDQVGHRPG
jgi:hypothetical protein